MKNLKHSFPYNYLFLRWDSRRNNFVCCAIVVFLFQLRTFQYSYLKFLRKSMCIHVQSITYMHPDKDVLFSNVSFTISKGKKK